MRNVTRLTFLKLLLTSDNLLAYYNKICLNDLVLYKNVKTRIPELKNNIVIIQDIPDYLKLDLLKNKGLKIKTVQTLKGHIVKLHTFQNINDYLLSNFKSKKRNNLKRYIKKLETCFPITYKTYYGSIDKNIYDNLFMVLKQLLIRRFEQKQELNYELRYLDEFHDTIYDLILQKKANIFVIYHEQKPISIRINMFRQHVAYYILSAYNIDYSKFHLGAIDMLKNIEWSINNKFVIYDLLKGYNNYKSVWANSVHKYVNHIIYNPKQKGASLVVIFLKNKMLIRYWLYGFYSKKNLDKYHKALKRYKFSAAKGRTKEEELTFKTYNLNQLPEHLEIINLKKDNTHLFLYKPLYDFLYATNDAVDTVKIFRFKDKPNNFVVQGKVKQQQIIVTK